MAGDEALVNPAPPSLLALLDSGSNPLDLVLMLVIVVGSFLLKSEIVVCIGLVLCALAWTVRRKSFTYSSWFMAVVFAIGGVLNMIVQQAAQAEQDARAAAAGAPSA